MPVYYIGLLTMTVSRPGVKEGRMIWLSEANWANPTKISMDGIKRACRKPAGKNRQATKASTPFFHVRSNLLLSIAL
jgi:hypothetical protein